MSLHRLATVSLLTITSTLAVQGTLTAHRVRTLTAEQEEILGHMSIVNLDDGQGGTTKTIRIEAVNVQVVNGLGATNGNPSAPTDDSSGVTNGLGNLIVGYNEFGHVDGDDRTGSHNLVAGYHQNVTSYGAIVIGRDNQILAPLSAITGGSSGTTSGYLASISGGNGGVASGQQASIAGGQLNIASGLRASVLGGGSNEARAEESVVVGGGHAFFRPEGNLTTGIRSCIVGGSGNLTQGHTSVVGGGFGRQALSNYDWVAGTLFQDN